MAKTVFDSSERNRKLRQQDLEQEVVAIQEESKNRQVSEVLDTGASPVQLQPQTFESPETQVHHDHPHVRVPEDYSEVLRDARKNGEGGGAFSAFVPQPNGMRFENQHEREQVLLVLRQHPIVNVKWIFIAILMITLPVLFSPFVPFAIVFPGVFMLLALVGWMLLVTAFVIESFLHWYFNIYIITDERIIDVDFYSLIYKEVSEAKLDKIEDVTATSAGFLSAIFNFGTIAVQTAAEKRQFEFQYVPQPAKVTKFLNELILEEEREKSEGRVM